MTAAFRSDFPVCAVQRSDRRRIVPQWGTKPRKDDREDEPGENEPAKETEVQKENDATSSSAAAFKNGDDLEGRPAILDIPELLPCGRSRRALPAESCSVPT